jgi:hypothetical protein
MRARRILWIVAAACLGLPLVLVLAGLPLYVFPPADEVSRADVIYVIGPPTPPRLREAEKLRAEGVADRLLISVSADGSRSAAELPICDEPYVTCRTPEPFTTNGETALLEEYARTAEVSSAVVLTFTPHVARTRFIFARCAAPQVTVVAIDEHLGLRQWAYQYLYQTAAFAKALFVPCADAAGAAQ